MPMQIRLATPVDQSVAKDLTLISFTEEWCVGMQRILERLRWRKLGQIAEVNKDGSTEWFHAISLGA